ncbi:NERD domain-containing protein [Micromonospora sp. LOL_021]|uniref:NERD domain-containing protein n=1 Tax=Micromonospora sp. LOL_021 TaxID=3345417 RepID=UPI003A8A6C3F
MVPEPISPSTKSAAEVSLYRRLKLLESDWIVALHSLNLPEHSWKRVSEVDFVVIGPRGIYILEVKGGHISCSDGVWTHRDRFGTERRRRESPFTQAREAMFVLQRRLEALVGHEAMRHVPVGYAVVVPDCNLSQSSVEWSEETLIDRRQLDRPDGLRRSLGRLASYWRSKPGDRRATLDSLDVDSIVQALRPTFDTVPTLRQIATEAEADLVALTDYQYRTLDAYGRNPRILIEGGAGTGKTMLAAELCRRSAAAGQKTLFTCHSQVVSGFVRHQQGMQDVHVTAFANLSGSGFEKFDVIVVDEAQDIINFTDLSKLDELLRDGLSNGSWYMFLDSNNQRGLVGSCDDEALQYIREWRPVELALRDNCRNTRQIVASTRRTTGADVGVSSAGDGPEVRIIVEPTRTAQSTAAAAELDRLDESGIPPRDITLLSPLPLETSLFSELPERWRRRIDVLNLHSLQRPTRGRIAFAQVEEFKGLESPFVLLGDVDPAGLAVTQRIPSLYVGMTRARVGLWIVAGEHPGSSEANQ